jgi:hypothetical protein
MRTRNAEIQRVAVCKPSFPTSGGLTPVAGRKRPQLQLRYHTHGGLTPAALVHVRFCIAKIVILSADGRCNTAKSGGRKPPVEKALLC